MTTNETNIQKQLDGLLRKQDEERLNGILGKLELLQTGLKNKKLTRITNALEENTTKKDYPSTTKHTKAGKERQKVALHDIINEYALKTNTNENNNGAKGNSGLNIWTEKSWQRPRFRVKSVLNLIGQIQFRDGHEHQQSKYP